MIYWVCIVLLVLISVIFILLFRNKRRMKGIPQIDAVYEFENGRIAASGNMVEFIIRKNERFEFLVRDGIIIACKDKKRHQEFVFYGEN